jgi:hypothetical protein
VGTPSGDGVPYLTLMARLSYALSIVSVVLGVLLVLVILSLSEGDINATGLLIGAVLILNGLIRLWARQR